MPTDMRFKREAWVEETKEAKHKAQTLAVDVVIMQQIGSAVRNSAEALRNLHLQTSISHH